MEPKSPFVFTSERGAPFSTAGFARMVERAGREAKLAFKAHPHLLRHTCGYALANKGHDTRALQAYLGHRNIQHTVTYTELTPTWFKDFWQDKYFANASRAIASDGLRELNGGKSSPSRSVSSSKRLIFSFFPESLMSEALTVPATIEEIIRRIDASADAVDEMVVAEEIGKARNALVEPSEAERLGAWSDALAFAFSVHNAGNNPWNSHFCPMGSLVDQEGIKRYFPDIAGTPPSAIDHWMQRAASLHHPVLVARYADVAWEFATAIGQKKRDPQMARTAVDAYLKSASGGFRSQDYYRYEALERALKLAILLKDHERIDAVRAEFMRLHRESIAGDQSQGWRAF